MKLGKIIDNRIVLIDVENGAELDGEHRSEINLYKDGWKKACPLLETPTEPTEWIEYPTCFVEQIKIMNIEDE